MPDFSYDPDYPNHPAFGRSFGRPTLLLRARALQIFSVSFLKVSGRHLINAARRAKVRSWTPPTSKGGDLARVLDADGVAGLFLGPEAMRVVRAALEPAVVQLRQARSTVPIERRQLSDNQLPVRAEIFPNAHRAIQTMLELAGALSLASGYLRRPVSIRFIVAQLNDESDPYWKNRFDVAGVADPNTNYMHVDTTDRIVKCILYLSDVRELSGCFSYVPGTHRRQVRTIESLTRFANDLSGLSSASPESRRLFCALPRVLQKKADFGKDLLDSSATSAYLCSNERRFMSTDGDLIVFDGRGVHRGGMVTAGERVILQIALG